MKRKLKILNLLCLTAVVVFSVSCNRDDDPVVRALAERLVPEYASSFRFGHLRDTVDCFEIESSGKKIVIRGNNANSIAVGLNWYLKNYCLTTVSWYADDPVEMPEDLPEVEETVRITARTQERFFLNYCTFGYTMPWWDWNDWERFIDWMALNGVTMPLAITGQEAVWQKVWRKHGLSDLQIRSYFTGPAHLPWHRMSNIDYWQGPLPQEWIDAQAELQKKILARERELGMTPVLPAFAGHVPTELKEIYPEAEITRVSFWGGFADRYRCSFLAPMDSLFSVIQKDFLEEQTSMFGTDHIYGADPFNEIDSPSWDPVTLADISSHIYRSMADVDKDAVWLQMGWLFYADPAHWTQENIKAFLGAVPEGKLVMLDYYCDFTEIWKQTNKFYGQPYIWCYLGNFGGNTMLAGNFRTVSSRIEDAFENGGDNLYGIGSTLEGFGVNQFMYEFVLEKAWNTGLSDDEWVERLADRRMGARDSAARKAWRLLADSIYVEHSYTGHSVLACAHPCLEGNWHWTTKPSVNYSIDDLYRAWTLLLQTSSGRDTYLYDAVNIGRQFLGDLFRPVRDRFAEAWLEKDLDAMDMYGDMMLGLIDDMERLVACHQSFSLERWLESARSFGQSEADKDYYERNARTLVSVWGDSYHLSDYASRSWSGMLSSYYGERWNMFIDRIMADAASGMDFDRKSFDDRIWEFENDWTDPGYGISFPECGDGVAVARELALKYAGYREVLD